MRNENNPNADCVSAAVRLYLTTEVVSFDQYTKQSSLSTLLAKLRHTYNDKCNMHPTVTRGGTMRAQITHAGGGVTTDFQISSLAATHNIIAQNKYPICQTEQQRSIQAINKNTSQQQCNGRGAVLIPLIRNAKYARI